jgi:hypothetical protein
MRMGIVKNDKKLYSWKFGCYYFFIPSEKGKNSIKEFT